MIDDEPSSPPAPDLAPPSPRPVAPAHHQRAWLRQTAGEHRLPAAIAVFCIVVLQVILPQKLAPQPHYLLPGVEVALFLVLLIGNPTRLVRQSKGLRAAALSLVVVNSVAVAWSAILLVRELLYARNLNGVQLLAWGIAIWLTNVIVFALWYWETDRGGPASRANACHDHVDFLFTQMTLDDSMGHRDWEPGFVDYFYLSFTNATAFSPTDTLPLTRWAKLTMLAQSAISLITVALVVARAVNVIG
jgi:uncharacterized membrane protein